MRNNDLPTYMARPVEVEYLARHFNCVKMDIGYRRSFLMPLEDSASGKKLCRDKSDIRTAKLQVNS